MTNNKELRDLILQFLTQGKKSSYSTEEISHGLGSSQVLDFKKFVQLIAEMERENLIKFTRKGKISLVSSDVFVEGIFHRNERGFGFVTFDEEEEDIYISKESTAYALDGDTVKVDIMKPARERDDRGPEGKVIEVLERAVTQIVGEFTAFTEEKVSRTELYGVVVPKDKKLSSFKVFVGAEGIKPLDGSICMVTMTRFPDANHPESLEGVVIKIVGHKNDPGMDILSIVVQHGIPVEFPEEVLVQAEAIPDKISSSDFESRRDLRDEMIVTIDGEGAKDLDDAVTVKKLDNGHFFLGVHIADVSYYVTENSPIDQEAFDRGTSVYLTDRVIPMLPQRLSNGICSLNPMVPRLTMSCEMEIDLAGKVVRYEIFPSVIQTAARMTYTAVNAILEDQDPEICEKYQELVPMFHKMKELHLILEKMREQRGAISFEDHEAEVRVDSEGHPYDILLRHRGLAEKLIESFMLIANETVAKNYHQLKLPFIYRIHEQPKEEKMQRFFEFATIFGVVVKGTKETIRPKDLQAVLEQVAGRPEEAVINTMMLRSMQQARYSEDSLGHYGLAAENYTHFTSPIRRYPDLIVHRLIRSYQDRPVAEKVKQHWQDEISEIADHSSKMERRSVEAERDTDSLKKSEFMMDKIGAEFDGIISSVTKFGVFVELPNTVEGLIHVNAMKQDYFHFVENRLALVGERTGLTLKLGQKVRVRVTKADPETREIDFDLILDKKNLEISQRALAKKKKGSRSKRQNNQERFSKSKSTKKGQAKKPFYKGVSKKKKKK